MRITSGHIWGARLLLTGRTGIVVSAVLAVPVRPGREEARSWMIRELSKREYAEARPGIVQRVLSWLMNELTELKVPLGPGPALGVTVVLVAVGALFAVALTRHWVRSARRRAGDAADVLGTNALTAAQHRAEATEHARAGRWDAAVLARFRAVARELEERAVLVPAPGRTANEIAVGAARGLPDLGAELRAAALLFDRVCYGRRAADQTGYARVSALDEAVRRARAETAPEPAEVDGGTW